MYQSKRILLIAGGGTLGSYTSRELLDRGATVDVICLEDHVSENDRLTYYREYVSQELLERLFAAHHYDGIVNFIHYKTVEEYEPIHELLIRNTDHLIFLSSYRAYADECHPVTEEAPHLLDVTRDEEFLAVEDYALPKARCERFLREKHAGEHWTIVRPVISFSHRRLDLFVYSDNDLREQMDKYGAVAMPTFAKDLVAGIDWAGNSGKLIANLLLKKGTIGEAYTVSSAQNLTWGEVAELYAELFDVKVEWCDEETFIKRYPNVTRDKKWMYLYDRKFSRDIDNRKILAATGLTSKDFLPIREGIKIEIENKKKFG